MTSTTNREPTIDIALKKNFFSDANSNGLTPEQEQAINSTTTTLNPIIKSYNFDFSDLKPRI